MPAVCRYCDCAECESLEASGVTKDLRKLSFVLQPCQAMAMAVGRETAHQEVGAETGA